VEPGILMGIAATALVKWTNSSQISVVSLEGDKSSSCLAIKLRTIYTNKLSSKKSPAWSWSSKISPQKQNTENMKEVEACLPGDIHSAEKFPSYLPIYPTWSARDSVSPPWNRLSVSQTPSNSQLFHGASSGDRHAPRASRSCLSKPSVPLGIGLGRISPRFVEQTCWTGDPLIQPPGLQIDEIWKCPNHICYVNI